MDIHSDDDICDQYKPAICRHRYIIALYHCVKDHHEHYNEHYHDHHDGEHHHDHCLCDHDQLGDANHW